MNATLTIKGRPLAELKSAAQWQRWKTKAKAYFMKRQLWDILNTPRPSTLQTFFTTDAEKEDWIQERRRELADERVVPDLTDIPREDVGAPPTERPETEGELLERQMTWDTGNRNIWLDLVDCCDEEAASIVEEAADEDGNAAYQALRARYDSTSVNSKFMTITALFRLKQTKGIEEHVTEYKSHLRKMNELHLTLAEDLQCVIFLLTLSEKFKTFRDNAMMQGNLTLQQLYQGAIEHSKVNLMGDEAKTKGVALFSADKPRGTGRQKPCRYKHKCRKWKSGKCKLYHPSPPSDRSEDNEDKNDNGGKRKERQYEQKWKCETCRFFNKQSQDQCKHCKTPKGKKRDTPNYRAQMATWRSRCDQMGIDPDSIFEGEGDTGTQMRANLARLHGPERALAVSQEGEVTHEFVVDSGATKHFVGPDVPLTECESLDAQVEVAGGKNLPVTEKGTCTGITGGEAISFSANRCKDFTHNLFSVFEAARAGSRTVLEWDDSYIENMTTKERTPLRRKGQGWTLDVKASTIQTRDTAMPAQQT